MFRVHFFVIKLAYYIRITNCLRASLYIEDLPRSEVRVGPQLSNLYTVLKSHHSKGCQMHQMFLCLQKCMIPRRISLKAIHASLFLYSAASIYSKKIIKIIWKLNDTFVLFWIHLYRNWRRVYQTSKTEAIFLLHYKEFWSKWII